MTTRYYFLQDFDESRNYDDGVIVSIMPEVSYACRIKGIGYKTLDDFYSEAELRADEDGYFRRQLDWIGQLDQYLKSKVAFIAEHSINIARLNYDTLKYLIDTYVIQSFISRAVVQAIDPNSEIVFIKKDSSAFSSSIESFRRKGQCIFYDHLLAIAVKQANHGQIFSPIILKESKLPHYHRVKPGMGQRLKSAVNQGLVGSFLKNTHQRVHYKNLSRIFPQTSKSELKVFFPHTGGHHLDPIISKLYRSDVTIYYPFEHQILTLNQMATTPYDISAVAQDDGDRAMIQEFAAAAKEIGAWKGISWIDQEAGIEISGLIRPYLQDLLANHMTKTLLRARKAAAFFVKNKVDYVFSHTSSDDLSKSALIAARLAGNVQTACVQHGCDINDDFVWHVTDLDPFDIYFSMDGHSEEKFKQAVAQKDYIKPCEIYQSAHFLISVKEKCISSLQRQENNHAKKKILYVPTKRTMHRRYFNCLNYPPLWYFEYLTRILEHLSAKQNIEVLYKHVLVTDKHADHSIIPYLQSRNYSNMTITDGNLSEFLKTVDGVMIDRATTGFFEAEASGLPVLSIYPDFIAGKLSQEGLRFFGASVQRFTEFGEAFQAIDLFLNAIEQGGAHAAMYSRPMLLREDSITDILTAHRKNASQLVNA